MRGVSTDFVSQVRWLAVKNTEGDEDAPPFAALEKTGETVGRVIYVRRPTTGSVPPDRVLFAGPVGIPADAEGQATEDLPAVALYEGDDPPGADDTLGTQVDSWMLGVGQEGFSAASADLNDEAVPGEGLALVSRVATGGGGPDLHYHLATRTVPNPGMYDQGFCDYPAQIAALLADAGDLQSEADYVVDTVEEWNGKGLLYPSGVSWQSTEYDSSLAWQPKPTAILPHVMYFSPRMFPHGGVVEKLGTFFFAHPFGATPGCADYEDYDADWIRTPFTFGGTLRLGIYETVSSTDHRPDDLVAQTPEIPFDTEWVHWIGFSGSAQANFPAFGTLNDPDDVAMPAGWRIPRRDRLYQFGIIWRPTRHTDWTTRYIQGTGMSSSKNRMTMGPCLHVTGTGQFQQEFVLSCGGVNPQAVQWLGSGFFFGVDAASISPFNGYTWGVYRGGSHGPKGNGRYGYTAPQVVATGNAFRTKVKGTIPWHPLPALTAIEGYENGLPPKIDANAAAYYWAGGPLPAQVNLDGIQTNTVCPHGYTATQPLDGAEGFGTPNIFVKLQGTDAAATDACADDDDGTDLPDLGCLAADVLCLAMSFDADMFIGQYSEAGIPIRATPCFDPTLPPFAEYGRAYCRLTRLYSTDWPAVFVGTLRIDMCWSGGGEVGITTLSWAVRLTLQEELCDSPVGTDCANLTIVSLTGGGGEVANVDGTPDDANPFHWTLPTSGSPANVFEITSDIPTAGHVAFRARNIEITEISSSGTSAGACDRTADFPDTGGDTNSGPFGD